MSGADIRNHDEHMRVEGDDSIAEETPKNAICLEVTQINQKRPFMTATIV